MDNSIKKSTDYDKFVLMGNNRDVARSHVEALKKAFEEQGNLTVVQPILVNENMEVIDGQHRFWAAQELGQPVYYSVRPGLTVRDARVMNILHRPWKVDDYVKSYAMSGDPQYQKYMEIQQEFGFNHSITITYIEGAQYPGMFAHFRQGDFTILDEDASRNRLRMLEEILDIAPHLQKSTAFAHAFLKIINNPDYDQKRMVSKLGQTGDSVLRRFGSVQEFLRAIEETYNYRQTNRTRLY